MLWLKFLSIIWDEEEIEVTLLVVSQLVGLSFDPRLGLQMVVVQELVAQDVWSGSLFLKDELSSCIPTIFEWMWSRCILVSVEQLENDVSSLPSALLLDADEDRFVVVKDIHKGLRIRIPEEQAVFGTLVSFLPEPTRLKLKFGLIVEFSGVTKVRSSTLSLLSNMECLARDQDITLSLLVKFNKRCILIRKRHSRWALCC
jgi:hypothetical protein